MCRRDEPVDTGYVKERDMSDTELKRRATPGAGGGGPNGEWLSYKERAAAREELDRRWGGPEWDDAAESVSRWTGWEVSAFVAGVALLLVVACQAVAS